MINGLRYDKSKAGWVRQPKGSGRTTCTQAIPMPTAPMILRWSRMNVSSFVMQPPWEKKRCPNTYGLHCMSYFNQSTDADAFVSRNHGKRALRGRRSHAAQLTHLHLVDVGGVVPFPAAQSGGFAAAVRHHPVPGQPRLHPLTFDPVRGTVAATALKLEEVIGKGKPFELFIHYADQWKCGHAINSCPFYHRSCRHTTERKCNTKLV